MHGDDGERSDDNGRADDVPGETALPVGRQVGRQVAQHEPLAGRTQGLERSADGACESCDRHVRQLGSRRDRHARLAHRAVHEARPEHRGETMPDQRGSGGEPGQGEARIGRRLVARAAQGAVIVGELGEVAREKVDRRRVAGEVGLAKR